MGFVGEFASSVIQPSQSGALTMRLDSLTMGQYNATAGFGGAVGPAIPTNYYLTLGNGVDSFKTTIPFTLANLAGGAAGAPGTLEETSTFFEALTVDAATASKFEGQPAVQAPGPGHP